MTPGKLQIGERYRLEQPETVIEILSVSDDRTSGKAWRTPTGALVEVNVVEILNGGWRGLPSAPSTMFLGTTKDNREIPFPIGVVQSVANRTYADNGAQATIPVVKLGDGTEVEILGRVRQQRFAEAYSLHRSK